MADTPTTRTRRKSATPKLDRLYNKVKSCLIDPTAEQLGDRQLKDWGIDDAIHAALPILTKSEGFVEELKLLDVSTGFGTRAHPRGAFGGHDLTAIYLRKRLSFDGHVITVLRARSS